MNFDELMNSLNCDELMSELLIISNQARYFSVARILFILFIILY